MPDTKPPPWRGWREEWRIARDECRAARDEARDEAREQWWDLIAEMRQERQITRRMWQRATGKPNPTRRERRRALRRAKAQDRNPG